ncbi:MAG: IS1634 family transposase [Alkaliphilus sp.]
MAAIVYQTNKKTGITYAYESVSFWDKEKQQSRAKRKCIGKVDSITKEIIPTRKKAPTTKATHSFYGATYLFDAIGDKTGLTNDLKLCFPDTYKKILSIAYYLILEDKNSLSRFPKWAATHKHPNGENISSQRSSELFASIADDARERFFYLQGKRRSEKEFWAYDTTSISSYSKCLTQIRYGVNKDHEPLPQINLAMLYGETSKLPFYYRKLAGNISDVKTLKHLLLDMDALGFEKVKLVMDSGFYSEKNINALYKEHRKFLMAAKTSLKFVKNALEKADDDIRTWANYNKQYDLYAHAVKVKWDYTQKRPYKGDTIKAERRMYLHLYFNGAKSIEDERNLHMRIARLQSELESDKRDPKHEKQYTKYFEMKITPVKGISITGKDEIIAEAKKRYGYFALISNEIKDPIEALEVYRNKDLIEKAFHDLKDRLGLNRLGVSSDLGLDGKLFVEFIALIYLSYIKKHMQEKELFVKYTLQELLDEFDLIECYEQSGRKLRVGEVTQKQIQLYKDMEISLPPSLQ